MDIGIDLGGTNIVAGLLDEKLNIVYSIEGPTNKEKGYDFIRDKIISIIENMILRAEDIGKKIDSIGIGIPSITDKTGDNVIYSANLNWRNVPFGRDLRKRFTQEINIENDAIVAAIAESKLGVSKGYKDSVFITIGTGIGSGIIINNKIHSGSHGVGAELGHTIVGENFYDCNCGNNGCLESFSSSTAIKLYTMKKINEGYKDTILLDKVNSLEEIDGKLIFDSAKLGDKLSNEAIDRMVKYLIIGITNTINTLDPGIIVIGGGVAKAGDFLLDKINALLPKYILFKEISHCEVKLAKLGDNAGVIGAALLSKYK